MRKVKSKEFLRKAGNFQIVFFCSLSESSKFHFNSLIIKSVSSASPLVAR